MSRKTSGGVVAGYDGSTSAASAVAWAAREASTAGLPLTVLYVADDTWAPAFGADEVMVDEARRIADEGAKLAEASGADVEVRASMVIGSPAGALVSASREAALVVVSNRGHGDVLGAFAGSVAFAVTAHAECPVVVARGDSSLSADGTRPVVVGVDGSPSAAAAVRFACDHAALHHAPIELVTAWQPVEAYGWALAHGPSLRTEGESGESGVAMTGAAREALRMASDLVHDLQPDIDLTCDMAHGHAGRALADRSRDAGLLVVGSRGRGGFTGLLLGSVSHAAIHAASCPVAVVRG